MPGRTATWVAGLAALLAVAWAVARPALAEEPGQLPAPLVGLSVEPQEVLLTGANRRQQLLVTGQLAGGGQVDLTRQAVFSSAGESIVRADGSVAAGVGNGATTMTVSALGRAVEVPVRAVGFETYPPVHFANDVVPIFSKLGCNNGGCHGRALGQNGFKLSVFGFDPLADYDALVKEARGRRVFPAAPGESLLLNKATGRVPHGGGQRLSPASADYELLFHWIEQGLPRGGDESPTVALIEVSPIERTLRFSGMQQLLATAVYSDGSRRDVTSAALYASNAPAIMEVEPGGLVRAGQVPGEAAITVSYQGQVAAVSIFVPRAKSAGTPGLSGENLPAEDTGPDGTGNEDTGPIDRLVLAKLARMGVPPSPLCDDATFLRRLYLDAIGTLPTPGEVTAFLADSNRGKRDRAIDAVLAREEFADYWALKWSDILLVDRQKLGDRGAEALHAWLREQIAAGRPYDQWVRELLLASGNSGTVGPVNFYRTLDTPDGLARALSQSLLGVRIECAQCHHHPLEKWSQHDYYGLAGFFHGLEKRPLGPNQLLLYHAGPREMTLPNTTEPVPLRVLGGPKLALPAGVDPRAALADWFVAPENPYFARLAVNRLWKQFLGRGLVEPEDDLRSTNPSTNEPLLAYLTAELTRGRFDLKAIMRQILTSHTWQRSSQPLVENADDEQNFSHYFVKRMPAEVLLDSINAACGVHESFPGRPPGTRAIALWDNRLPSYFLDIFGRPERTSPCECGRSSEPTMAQALHLMNAVEIEAKISSPEGRAARLAAVHTSGGTEVGAARVTPEARDAIVRELCLATLGRQPAAKEHAVAEKLFAESSPTEASQDLLWTLLNSYDFFFIR